MRISMHNRPGCSCGPQSVPRLGQVLLEGEGGEYTKSTTWRFRVSCCLSMDVVICIWLLQMEFVLRVNFTAEVIVILEKFCFIPRDSNSEFVHESNCHPPSPPHPPATTPAFMPRTRGELLKMFLTNFESDPQDLLDVEILPMSSLVGFFFFCFTRTRSVFVRNSCGICRLAVKRVELGKTCSRSRSRSRKSFYPRSSEHSPTAADDLESKR